MTGRAVFPGAMPLRGEQGYAGERGTQGLQGVPGDDGAPGAPGVVQAVQGTAPVVVGGTAATPVVSMPAATAAVPGHMTAAQASKLDGIAAGATNYTHPANHAPSIITQDANSRFVTDAEKASWSGKQAALGYTPENVASKDASGGYAGLTLFKLNLRNAADTFTSFLTNAATAARTWTMQNRDGTVALTDDITGGLLGGSFTTLASTGNATLGDAITDTLNVGNGGLIKDAAGNVGIGGAPLAWGSDKTALAFGVSGAALWGHNTLKLCGISCNFYFTDTAKLAIAATESAEVIAATGGAALRHYASVIAGTSIGSPDSHFVVNANGALQVAPVGIGYGAGAGGTVTQATSKTTGVTLNKPSGVITMNNAALAASASVIFTLTNSLISATDTVAVDHGAAGGTANAYIVQRLTVSAGAVNLRVTNISAGSLSEAVSINFTVNKGVSA